MSIHSMTADEDTAGPATPALVLGYRDYQPSPWWTDPVWAVLFLVLPIFCAAAYLNRYNYWSFGASEDFVTRQTFGLGLYSMMLLILGILAGRLALRRRDQVTLISEEHATVILTRLGWVTILAYALLFGTLMFNLGLVLDLLRGNAAAAYELRDNLSRIPGITSFIQFDVVYLTLVSALVTLSRFRMSKKLWVMSAIILFLTFVRSLVASERLALLEALAAMFVVPVAYRWRPSPIRAMAPFIGAVFVFVLFAGEEYFRSWQYYRLFYNSYSTFIVQRFLGYFSTSINNGAGAYLLYGKSHPVPEITSAWVTKFPILSQHFDHGISMLDKFLTTYADPEFNNPGGFYSAFLDYPFLTASVFMFLIGMVIGLIHRSFQNKGMVGLMLYPVIFMGMTDLIRLLYITDTRTLPIFIGVAFTLYAIKAVALPRKNFLPQIQADAAL